MLRKKRTLIGSLFIVGLLLVSLIIARQNRGKTLTEDFLIHISGDDFLINGSNIADDSVQDVIRTQRQAGGFSQCRVVLDERILLGRVRKTLVPFLDVISGDVLFSTTGNTTGVLVTPLVCPTTFIQAQTFSLLITKDAMRILTKDGRGDTITREQISIKRNNLGPVRINFSVNDDVTAKRFYEVIADLTSLRNAFLVWFPNTESQ